MALKIYNTASGAKEEFHSLERGVVKIYCCGPTVYDLLHIGNFRGAIFFNLVRNWLTQKGYQVRFVYNYTDIDDKIIARAQKENSEAGELAEKYIREFEKDYDRLGLTRADSNPRVSEHLQTILDLIQDLVSLGKAYDVQGDVYFSVKSFPTYGQLSHRNSEDLRTAVRIDLNEQKRDPLDFALWKKSKTGEPAWDSPWGRGRPGWHIECSAMIRALLGDRIDIHGGGLDLLFPHHENERAQSEACTGQKFVNYWMHNNMIEFAGAKMSKSLGNVRTARSFMDAHSPELLKYLILSVHYRSICDFSENNLQNITRSLARIYSALAQAEKWLGIDSASSPSVSSPIDMTTSSSPHFEGWSAFLKEQDLKISHALDDDFNTPEVLAAIFEVVRRFNAEMSSKSKSKALADNFRNWILGWGRLFSLFQRPAREFLRNLDDQLLRDKSLQREVIQAKVDLRWQARLAKDWKQSDALREELRALGIELQDSPAGTEWEVAK